MRATIDSIDEAILALLNRRAQAAIDVAGIKSSLPSPPRYYRPEREAQLLSRLAARQKRDGGALPASETIRLFREIASSCRSLEQRLTIAWTDPSTMHAALGHFGGAIDLCRFESEEEALAAVAARQCDYAMIAFVHDGCANPLLIAAPFEGQALVGEWRNERGDGFLAVGAERVPASGNACSVLSIASQDKEALERALLDGSPPPTVDFYPLRKTSLDEGKRPSAQADGWADGWIVRIANIDEEALEDRIGSSPLGGMRRSPAWISVGSSTGSSACQADDASHSGENDGERGQSPILLGSFPIVDTTFAP
ncbi:chorismate mutase [Thioalkalivibrio sp. HK1]|uniref:chorismate mutase n=1 Tax=Thioalkalivibrio sp. HK1 TaxID=1469245 RepID=UPI001E5347C5|nr:chorismate mutase [Thioalkalivibrio sp. HK1]